MHDRLNTLRQSALYLCFREWEAVQIMKESMMDKELDNNLLLGHKYFHQVSRKHHIWARQVLHICSHPLAKKSMQKGLGLEVTPSLLDASIPHPALVCSPDALFQHPQRCANMQQVIRASGGKASLLLAVWVSTWPLRGILQPCQTVAGEPYKLDMIHGYIMVSSCSPYHHFLWF